MDVPDDLPHVTRRARPGDDDALRRLLADPGATPQLHELLAALRAGPDDSPQAGETAALAVFRELVAEPAGVYSMRGRRRIRVTAALASSVVVVMSGGVAAAAADALPAGAQQVAHNVLQIVGVQVPGPNAAPGSGPDGPPNPGQTPPADTPSRPALPTPSSHPSAHPAAVPTPGNAGPSRHHGNPTPTATQRPTPGHGKPTASPLTSGRKTPMPTHPAKVSTVMRGRERAITR
jgi:hypothetical protein